VFPWCRLSPDIWPAFERWLLLNLGDMPGLAAALACALLAAQLAVAAGGRQPQRSQEAPPNPGTDSSPDGDPGASPDPTLNPATVSRPDPDPPAAPASDLQHTPATEPADTAPPQPVAGQAAGSRARTASPMTRVSRALRPGACLSAGALDDAHAVLQLVGLRPLFFHQAAHVV